MATEKKNKTQPHATVQNFPIVGIGASAGGLDAFKRLLTAIPESSGMAYVLVQHLDPSHESMLPEILQRVTKIPVHEITEEIHLAPDHIYIIPANKILTSTDGVLQLAPRDKKILNLSIDIFFTSLAEVHKEFAVGVILSGTGKDGTQGLKAIKEYEGICIAQDMESAAYDSMPENAINAGVVDFILAPEKIPDQLLQINSVDSTSHVHKKEKQQAKDEGAVFKQILSQLRQRSGVDFTHYKDPTLHRRIARRIAIVKKKNLTTYLDFLRADIAEQDALFQDMLIPVTSFFRDPKTFDTLTETVFPSILKNKNPDDPIRIWIAGCSTGQEAYSIAICLQEFLAANPHSYRERRQIQIFASDISEKAIKKARTGIYTKADVETLSASQLENYFTKNNGGYEVSKLIRDMCVIAPHNFLKDPPFAKMDLISCRNVLIYMDTFLQQKAFATFHYALKEHGFLLLGKSESIGASSDLFAQVAKKDKIYSRKGVAGRFRHVATELNEEASTRKAKTVAKHEATQTDFKKSAEAIMISRSPASVVVNAQMDIVHIHGDITPFLQTPQGKPTHNLLSMARDGLTFELRNAIHKASKDKIAVTTENIPLKINATMDDSDSHRDGQGKQTLVAMEIIPLTDTVERHYLIRFEKITVPKVKEGKSASSGKTKAGEAEKRNEQLEKELAYNREDMRCITEDMEAGNEELQSANEELQSSNEEMQSLNEELETSKEELQSTNEELIIINQELFEKQEQLNAARLYSDSIVSTIRHPLIVLDKSLCIKTANAAFYKKFNVDEKETENKWFYEIQHHQFDDDKLRSLLIKVLSRKNHIDDFEIVLKLPEIGERTLLMNARQVKNEITAEQLILLAIEDVTEKVVAHKKIEASEKRFSNILEQSIMGISIFKGREMRIAFANEPMMTILGKGKDIIDKALLEVLPELKDQPFPKLLDDVYKTGVPYYGHETKATIIRNGKEVETYFNFVYQPYREVDNTITGITVLATDVGDQVLAKKQIEVSEKRYRELSGSLEIKVNERTALLKKSNEELKQTNTQLDQFAHVASHDLQEPLRKILTFSNLLQDNRKDELSTEAKSYLDKIERSSLRMSTLIRDLLNFSRLLQHEKLIVQTDLNETLKNILDDFELLVHEKKAQIKFDEFPTIDAIPMQMNQLFYNLISNALKFSREDVPPVITITSRKLSEKQIKKYPTFNPSKAYVEIIFKDNGIGFEQQYSKQIFTIFQRLHNKETFAGTGIGLALTKKIIENHQGAIFADAKINKGASFHIILPFKQSL
jgi:two-component system CheB/CheR fusion protein